MSLKERLGKPGFTPGAKDIAELFVFLASDDEKAATQVERTLLKAPELALQQALAVLPTSVRPGRGRIVQLLGRLTEATLTEGEQAAVATTLRSLAMDLDLKTQLNAVTALGRLPGAATEQLLCKLWRSSPRPELRRALLRSLGKAGGEEARALLAQVPPLADAEEQRLLEQALLILGRTATRSSASGIGRIKGEVAWGTPVKLRLSCRAGLEGWLAEEAKGYHFAVGSVRQGAVDLSFAGPLNQLLQLRLMEWLTILLPVANTKGMAIEERIGATLAAPATQKLMVTLTEGTPRYRIDWPEASRSAIWALAKHLTQAVPTAVNDPRESLWELQIRGSSGKGSQLSVALSPKRLDDPRFSYRLQDVPASSHPTLAAALARLAKVQSNDIVWDPFTGAGTELIEIAKSGPCRLLYGTDLSGDAIERANANIAAAGITASTGKSGVRLEVRDSLQVTGIRPTLVVSNPPMGRRVARGELKPLIRAFIDHVARELAPGGRLVWISPLPDATALQLNQVGLTVQLRQRVDMGGFDAEIQVATKST